MASSLTANSLIINDTQEITGVSNTLNDSANEIVTSGGLIDFLYEHGILTPPKKVGGVIFYIDSTADGTYKFYNASGTEVSAPTVGTDCTNWTYEVTGASKDKFYVYESTTGLVNSKYWGYNNITTSATGNSIGAGKTNTSTVLAITDTSDYASDSIWEYIRNMRTNKTNGCDDWFVGCEAEYDQLMNSGTTGASWFGYPFSLPIWSSHEISSDRARYWNYAMPEWSTVGKSAGYALVPIRSF